MRFLITGGAGFIGSALIRYIINDTSYEVLNIDSLTYSGNLESLEHIIDSKRYSFAKADICDKEEISHLIADYKPNIVMNLAAESHVDKSIESPNDFIQTNVIGTFNLLQQSYDYYKNLSLESKNNFKFIHISTDEVFGDLENSKDLFTENTSYNPSSPYSASKASSDHLVRAWNRTYGLPTLITNCSNNYGPYQFPEKLIPHIILNCLSGKKIPIYGDGMQIRDWLYVDDHVKALVSIALNGQIGSGYNIGGNNEKTNLEVVSLICNLLDEFIEKKPLGVNSFSDLIEFVDDRPGHDRRYAIDATKIKKEIGWIPEETFETGIRKTVKWYLDNEKWWGRVLDGSYILERKGMINE